MLVTLVAPNAGSLRGMGIPAGVTVIAGGGFHGKSTLLRALERGVYNHIPGDGREQVVTVEDAVKIRAEDGRSVTGVDISTSIDPYRARRRKIKLRGMARMQFGGEELALGTLEQLVHARQLRAGGEMLV